MRKREFIKKTGILSVSMLAVPSLGFGEKSTKYLTWFIHKLSAPL